MQKILVMNGPNLNLLGKREPEIYGTQTFMEFFDLLKQEFSPSSVTASQGIELEYFQSNHEGDLLDKLHDVGFDPLYRGVVLNAGAYTHTSIALQDAIASIKTPVLEVHISNIHAREAFRHHSFIAPKCVGSIVGLGLEGYRIAIQYFINKNKKIIY